ncbi:unnamed protein product, partial [Iphiclides podalirius]
MDVSKEIALVFVVYIMGIKAVPPEACFANFRWEDCGQTPVPVMYYWKPGSRCEVGFWRGCLPNPNMFRDEYECVATCIFAARAGDEDYHKIYGSDEQELSTVQTTVTTVDDNYTDTTTGESVVTTDGTGSTAATVVGGDTKATDYTHSEATGETNAVTAETAMTT